MERNNQKEEGFIPVIPPVMLKEQMAREPYPLPKLWLNPEIKNIFDFKMEDIKLIDYKYHPTIKAPMAV